LIGTEPFGPDPSTLIGAMDLSCAPARWGRNLEAGEGHSAANRCWDWSWMNPEMSCFEQSTPRTGDEKLSTAMRRLLDFLWQEWKGLQMQIESLNTELEQIASSDPSCVRLQQIPGVGPWSRLRSYRPSGTARLSKKDGSLRPGWDWCRTRVPRSRPCAKGQNTTAPVISDSPRAGVDDVWYASKLRRGIRVTSFSREMIASTGPLIDGQEKRQE